mgnify:CR=1 FL=1
MESSAARRRESFARRFDMGVIDHLVTPLAPLTRGGFIGAGLVSWLAGRRLICRLPGAARIVHPVACGRGLSAHSRGGG